VFGKSNVPAADKNYLLQKYLHAYNVINTQITAMSSPQQDAQRDEAQKIAFDNMRIDADDPSRWTLPQYLALRDYLRQKGRKRSKWELYVKRLAFNNSALFRTFRTEQSAGSYKHLFKDEEYIKNRNEYNAKHGFPDAESTQNVANELREANSGNLLLIRLSL
tara:strand:+ start:798 stop:1286 length:489 start_codon:yes stop_codon:yes gene_type:complete